MMKPIKLIPTVIAMLILGGCGQSGTSITESKITSETTQKASETTAYTTEQDPEEQIEQTAPTLLYMGQASIRIVTGHGKFIYIDPYAGDAYDLPADLILVTHDHYDHSDVDKVTNRSPDCEIITHKEAAVNGEHKTFELGYVTVEAFEAGFND